MNSHVVPIDILLIALPVYKIPGVPAGEIVDFYHKGNEFPIGLMSIAAYLNAHDHPVSVISLDGYIIRADCAFENSLDTLRMFIKKLTPAFLGFGIPYKLQENFAHRLIQTVQHEFPGLKILIGGSHISADPYAFFDLNVEIICGEGERAVLDILDDQGRTGLHTRQVSKKLKLPKLTERVKGGELPALDYSRLILPDTLNLSSFTHFLPASRGCVGRCMFCTSTTIWSGGIEKKPILRLRWEIEQLVQAGIKIIDLVDDVINSDHDYFLDICALTKEFPDILFPIMSRLDLLTRENLQLMMDAGMISLYLGVESTQEQVLKKMNKRLNPSDFIPILKYARDLGIRIGTFWMFGHPGSSRDLDYRSLDDLHYWFTSGVIDEASLGIFLPVPGTFSANDASVQLLNTASEMWTGMRPVHRLIKNDGTTEYHEDEMSCVLNEGLRILTEFNCNNNEILVKDSSENPLT